MQLEVLEKQLLPSKAGFSTAKVTEDAWDFEQDVWRSLTARGWSPMRGLISLGVDMEDSKELSTTFERKAETTHRSIDQRPPSLNHIPRQRFGQLPLTWI